MAVGMTSIGMEVRYRAFLLLGRLSPMAVAAVMSLLLILVASPAHAVLPDEILKDAALEARARTLSRELRCLVCQNQAIDDSDAPLARDLRVLVRERLTAGDSDAQAMAFIVARYGTFVLLKPPVQPNTLILWLMPLVLLAGAIVGFRRHLSKHRQATAPAPDLTAEETRRLEGLTGDKPAPPGAR
jgi:cytochrome c-type biogenesis protein CcmH